MMEHRKIRLSLYDYALGEVDEAMQRKIALHLEKCDSCRVELAELQSVIALTDPEGAGRNAAGREAADGNTARGGTSVRSRQSPSDERGDAFWTAFPFAIEEKLAQAQSSKGKAAMRQAGIGRFAEILRDFTSPLFIYRRRSAGFLAAGLAVGVIAGIILTNREIPTRAEDVAQNVSRSAETTAQPAEMPLLEVDRMQRYFRKSKMLLVGIENMKMSPDASVDFAVERHASRELLQEARYLKYQPLDSRSAKLIGDLEKILIELSTIKEETGLPNVEIVRGGIQQENLLFKIRMAEAIYDTTKFMKSNYHY
jgi:anti-sigma factor RsiW